MYPILFQLGSLPLHTYGLFVGLGFVSTLAIAKHLRRRQGLPDAPIDGLALWLIGSGLFFARAAYVAEHWRAEFANAPFYEVLRVTSGGLMFFGGFLGAVLTLWLYARFHRESFLGLADVASVAVPAAHALGRVGCFFSGCCHGVVTGSWWGVCFPGGSPAWRLHAERGLLSAGAHESLPVIPVQLVEALANALIFAALYFFHRRLGRFPGLVTGLYLMLYAVLRFNIEFIRGDERQALGFLSIGQAIAVGTFLFGAALAGKATVCK